MNRAQLEEFRCCAWRTVSYRAAEMAAARADLEGGHAGDAIVTSCQRLEAYGFGECGCDAPEQLRGYAALERLAAVAAGLESVVLGEDQVTGQVRSAFAHVSGDLRAGFDLAISAARALRAETKFDSHAGHLLDKALRLSTVQPGGSLLVLGVGAMGKLVAERGVELGFDVTVAARRVPEQPVAGAFVELANVPGLPRFDVIVGCLGSGAGEIAPRVLPAARLLIDLGTPRNFSVLSGPGVVAISDMLEDEHSRPHSMAKRRRLRQRLGNILDARIARLQEDSRSPIGALRAQVEAIRKEEVERAMRLHPDVPEAVLEAVTRSLIDKVFHAPTSRMRGLQNDELARELAALFER
ncbi:MAG: hypothetical protein AB7J35_01665 [Dehalococcoidia bacterium]